MTPDDELTLRLALTRLTRIRPEHQRMLYEAFRSALDIYNSVPVLDSRLPGATEALRSELTLIDSHVQWAQQEIQYCRDNGIDILCHDDARFPQLLNQCHDAPTVLYSRGTTNLNAPHIVASVGTRRCTEYGRDVCRHLYAQLARMVPGVVIVSGLAYGIDIESHRSALAAGTPTVAVVAHGLDEVYPTVHRATLNEMLAQGGAVLTEYPHATRIDKRNFVERNRIVAGMSHATVVVESAAKGGSLITACLASDYNREVFACPGRISDVQSEGCNQLIATHRAQLLTSADSLVKEMGWEDAGQPVQGELFEDACGLSPEAEQVHAALVRMEQATADALSSATGLTARRLNTLLGQLEMSGHIRLVAGDCYRWVY